MAIWFTSDPHYFHSNIIGYCNRPFSDVNEMNEKLISNYNSVVSPDDIVFMLGDLGFAHSDKLKAVIRQLNGYKVAVKGNHDKSIAGLLKLGFAEAHNRVLFDWIRGYWHVAATGANGDPFDRDVDKTLVKLCHYPYKNIKDDHHSKEKSYWKSYPEPSHNLLLHGHVHSKKGSHIRTFDGVVSYDVGVDSHDYFPVAFTDIYNEVKDIINIDPDVIYF